MKLKIYYIGHNKKNHHADVEQLYLKRLKNYLPSEIIALSPQKHSSSLSKEEIQAKEAQYFKKHLDPKASVILLDEKGKTYTSKTFSKFMVQEMNSGVKTLAFVIGGAYGFSEGMKKEYRKHLRLSDLTFAHHLARVVLLEQLYRAYTIINNEPYHNS